jgi:hypothetical protein
MVRSAIGEAERLKYGLTYCAANHRASISWKSCHQPDFGGTDALVNGKSANRSYNSDRDDRDRYKKPNVVRLLYG